MKGIAPLSMGALVAALFATVVAVPAEAKEKKFHFDMVRGAKLVASGCLPNATAHVSIRPGGPVEVMDVSVEGLPPYTEFDFL